MGKNEMDEESFLLYYKREQKVKREGGINKDGGSEHMERKLWKHTHGGGGGGLDGALSALTQRR